MRWVRISYPRRSIQQSRLVVHLQSRNLEDICYFIPYEVRLDIGLRNIGNQCPEIYCWTLLRSSYLLSQWWLLCNTHCLWWVFKENIDLWTYSLNVLIGHYLDFKEAYWSAQLPHDKIINNFINIQCLLWNNYHGPKFNKYDRCTLKFWKILIL